MTDLPILTASRLSNARACQRLHHYRYNLGYRPAEDPATLRFGTLIHAGLEAWWADPNPNYALDQALFAMAGEADPFERATAEALLAGYDARWSEDKAKYQVVQVEAEFRAPLVNPETGRPSQTWQLGGKIDALATEIDSGRRILIEHKTTSEDLSPGTDYWRRLRMDGQVSLYYAGAEELGFPSDSCLYDVLRKPLQRPKKKAAEVKLKKDGTPYANQQAADETPEEFRARIIEAIAEDPNAYFARAEVVRLEGEVAESVFDVWQLGQQLREADRLERYPRNPGACLQYGRTCPFLGVCSGETSLDDPTLYRRISTPHPELAIPASAA